MKNSISETKIILDDSVQHGTLDWLRNKNDIEEWEISEIWVKPVVGVFVLVLIS